MAAIQWRPEINAMTTPQSYWIRYLPRNVASKADMAARMAKVLPNYSEEEFRTFIDLHNQLIAESLSSGEQVTEENAFTYSLAFTGRLNSPDDPLPPLDQCLQVRIYASQPFVDSVRQAAKTERLPLEKKLPLIATAKDTVSGLKDALNPAGVLLLTGENLFFDRTKPDAGGCVIEGTRSGRTAQSRFVRIEPGEMLLMPEIPAQANPWNNEYTISVSARYSERGTLRTGTYSRMLRAPLPVNGFASETGILTGRASNPYVSIMSGSVSADETLRIQVTLDLRADVLLFNLADMQAEGGRTGAAVAVTGNGEQTLAGFSGSTVNSLTVRVNNFAALKELIRDSYGGRLTDILEVRTA
jgi:hypothetical protein